MSNTLSIVTQSPISANFMRMDEINDTLNSIFISPKELSFLMQKELNCILCEIDKIYMKNSQKEIENIYNQMNKLKEDERGELILLEEKLSLLFIKNENVNITKNDEILLEKLNKQVDALCEKRELSEIELSYADALFDEKTALLNAVLHT